MKHIVFHNDVDGVFSAALFASGTDAFKDMDYVLHAVPTSFRGDKFNDMMSKINDPLFIFDFQYHAKAGLWIDHHQNDQMGNESIVNEKICYDNRARSAAGLVVRYLESLGIQTSSEATKVVRSADMIDSADYPNLQFIFEDRSSAMVLRSFFEFSYPSEMMFGRVVEVLVACELNLEKTLQVLNIDGSYVDAIRDKAVKTRDKIELYGKVSVIRQKYAYQYPRYAEYYATNSKYNVRISDENKTDFRVSLTYNKWHGEKNAINIGSYCASSKIIKRGGGHYNVGGGIVEKAKIDEFLDQFSEAVGE